MMSKSRRAFDGGVEGRSKKMRSATERRWGGGSEVGRVRDGDGVMTLIMVWRIFWWVHLDFARMQCTQGPQGLRRCALYATVCLFFAIIFCLCVPFMQLSLLTTPQLIVIYRANSTSNLTQSSASSSFNFLQTAVATLWYRHIIIIATLGKEANAVSKALHSVAC